MDKLGYAPTPAIQWSPPVVLVGEDNPYSLDARYALFDLPERAAGHRLRTLVFGVRRTTYARFHRMNCCLGKWSMREARERLLLAFNDLPEGATFMFVGRKVHEAAGCGHLPVFSWWDWQGDTNRHTAILLPHPSGRNRAWNEPGAVERARNLLRERRPDIPWGEE